MQIASAIRNPGDEPKPELSTAQIAFSEVLAKALASYWRAQPKSAGPSVPPNPVNSEGDSALCSEHRSGH